MSRYDWSKAPFWARYAATDDDGEAFWFEKEPKWRSDGIWRELYGMTERIDVCGKESLESRPSQPWESERRVNIGAKP